jgi:hypothetical protein
MVFYTSKDYSTLSSANFQWKNGDIIWNNSGTGLVTNVFDTGIYNIGNITSRIIDFENYGRGIYVSKHLRSQVTIDNTDTVHFAYTLDTGGRLTTLTETDPGNYVKTTQITYNCE